MYGTSNIEDVKLISTEHSDRQCIDSVIRINMYDCEDDKPHKTFSYPILLHKDLIVVFCQGYAYVL